MDSNGTFWSVPWSSLRSEAFGVEESFAVRREAVRARADAEAGADGERGGLQVAAQTSIHFFVNSESELVLCFFSEKFGKLGIDRHSFDELICIEGEGERWTGQQARCPTGAP